MLAVLALILAPGALVGNEVETPGKKDLSRYRGKMPADHPPINSNSNSFRGVPRDSDLRELARSPEEGRILQVIAGGGYTYLEVAIDGRKGKQWVAMSERKVEKGQTIRFSSPLEMKNFYSKSLDRTFPSIYFLSQVTLKPDAGSIPIAK